MAVVKSPPADGHFDMPDGLPDISEGDTLTQPPQTDISNNGDLASSVKDLVNTVQCMSSKVDKCEGRQ
ncbi:hypothetical protein HN873_066350 [Arachis hypogaea]